MRLLLIAASALASFAATRASADWPMQRHDPRRTATGDGAARMDRPAIAVRHYLGGALAADQYLAHDVDRDGRAEIVFVLGGAIVAKTPFDAVVWETPSLDVFRLDALADLNGDGRPELVASADAGRIHVLDPDTGTVLWSLPRGIVGNVGAVRLARLDAAPGLDLYVAEAACGSAGALGDSARAYSFGASLSSPAMLFELERGRRDYICGQHDTLADVDGDGVLDVVVQGTRVFYVYSTLDGRLRSASADIGSLPYGTAQVFAVSSDADSGVELVCFTENTYDASVNSRRVFAMDWDAASGRLELRWERSVSDVSADRHGWFPGGVEDLGGDGRVEVVTSFYSGAMGTWSTVVYDARDGSEIARLARGPFQGLVDLDGDGSSEVLTGSAESGLGVYRLEPAGLTRTLLQPGVRAVHVRDRSDPEWPSFPRWEPLALDLDGDARSELLVLQREPDPDGRSTLLALAPGDPAREVARLEVEEDVALLAFQPFPNVTTASTQVLLVRSDGYLWVLDARLSPTNAAIAGDEFRSRGLRVGGYYSGRTGVGSAPIAADLDADGADDIVARDSRGHLLRLDVRRATLVEPPTMLFDVPGNWAATVELIDGASPEVVVATTDRISALRADGTPIWSTRVGDLAMSVQGDLVFGDVSGDSVPDIAYQLYSSSDGTVHVNVLDGRSGARLWAADYQRLVAGSGLGRISLYDRDGDGRLDVLVTPQNLFEWLSGLDGSPIGAAADGGYPQTGVLQDLDADATLEIVSAGAYYGVSAFELDLTPIWTDRSGLHIGQLGSIAMCSGAPRMIQGHIASPRITTWDARSGSVVADFALLDGRVWEPPASAPDQPGVLGNVTIAPDLVGDARPTALVPSTDGRLYALDPCTGALRWSLDFRYPVGEAVLADPDGDGEDEIVVSVADGFLYVVDRELLPAPAWVYENAGRGPATSEAEDVDELATSDRLWANWADVPGATAYEYAVITPGGAFLTSPSFVNVGAETSATAIDLPLRPGQRYVFAVRAIGAAGTSSEALSDGVVVLPDPCASCGAGEICRDGVCLPDPCAGVMCPAGSSCDRGTCSEIDGGAPSLEDGGRATRGRAGSGGCCSIAAGIGEGRGTIAVALVVLALARARTRRRRAGIDRGNFGPRAS